MNPWRHFKSWRVRRALRQLAQDYETFPRLLPLRTRGWILMASYYKPALSRKTELDTIRKFRKLNVPTRQL